ncbi:hypothetical protein ACF0H5_008191 [Mactra antiquata]
MSSVNSRVTHTDESGSFTKNKGLDKTKGKDKSWLQIADEYMTNFVNEYMTSKTNGTNGGNGFFSNFVGGIMNTSTELAQKNGTNNYYKSGKNKKKGKKNDKKDSWYTNWKGRFS